MTSSQQGPKIEKQMICTSLLITLITLTDSEGSEDNGRGRYRCGIYAAGFDSSRNIFLGEKATKWEAQEGQEVDGLTTNGVLIMHPKAVFCPGPDYRGEVAKPGIWREVSVGGKVFGLRESRSAATQVRSIFMKYEHILEISTSFRDLLWKTRITRW